MTFEELLRKGQAVLAAHQIENPKFDARLLLNHVLGIEAAQRSNLQVEDYEEAYLISLKRRCQREPVAKIIGSKGFWKDDFYVSQATLDPRPDTETLIEAVLSRVKESLSSLTILDLGTGSGCIALSLARELSKAEVIGIDLSYDAVAVAVKNAQRLGLTERCRFIKADWNDLASLKLEPFDLIVANPPYIKEDELEWLEPEVAWFEPKMALLGGKTGLSAYQAIAGMLKPYVKKESLIFLEIGAGQAEDVIKLMTKEGFVFKQKYYDLTPKIRCLEFGLN